MLVSVHIPKCAGTSFRYALRHLYRERTWDNYGRIFSRAQARPGIVPAGTACIHGHFLADAFDDLFPGQELITWLRHPVERVVSTYQHFRRTPDFRDDCCRAMYERELTLREFADLEWMSNTASHYFAGKTLDDFAFVGIVEQFAASLGRFTARFGGSQLPMPRTNVNLERTTAKYDLSDADFAYILSRNATDYWWYQQAEARLHREFEPVRVLPRVPAVRRASEELAAAWRPIQAV